MIRPEYLYHYLGIILLAGIIICVLILRKQKRGREGQQSVDDRKPETPAVRSASMEPAKAETAAAPSPDQIDLNTVLPEEGLRLLATDLSCLADKLQAQGVGIEEVNVVRVVSELVSRTGCIPKQALNLCIAATQDVVDSVSSTFGISMGGHNALLENLKKLQD